MIITVSVFLGDLRRETICLRRISFLWLFLKLNENFTANTKNWKKITKISIKSCFYSAGKRKSSNKLPQNVPFLSRLTTSFGQLSKRFFFYSGIRNTNPSTHLWAQVMSPSVIIEVTRGEDAIKFSNINFARDDDWQLNKLWKS